MKTILIDVPDDLYITMTDYLNQQGIFLPTPKQIGEQIIIEVRRGILYRKLHKNQSK